MKNIIVVPTYNEKENIAVLVPLVFNLMPSVYLVVADDNSPDGTAGVVTEMQKLYPNLSLVSRTVKDGLGRAYINAFSHVLKDPEVSVIVMMDGDLSLQPKYVSEMIEKTKEYSVVTGSRYVKGSEIVGWSIWRRILSFCANTYFRNILRLPMRDCTCGFNAMDANFLRKIDFSKMSMKGYAFQIELKYTLYKAGATFFEVPIVFIERTMGKSKISGNVIWEGILAPWKMISKK